ncbi:MAG: adenylyl-sulfate kinase [Janthinobacterium lividum]
MSGAPAPRPTAVWFTGLSGSGKSTIAGLAAARLRALGRPVFVLDGDALRAGLCRDLGFSPADRAENIRRAAEVAAMLLDAGLVVLACFISPMRADRDRARARLGDAFAEAFVDTPVAECRRRDPKGLYRRADAGLVAQFTGVGAPYEAPDAPELRLVTAELGAEALADAVVGFVLGRRSKVEAPPRTPPKAAPLDCLS